MLDTLYTKVAAFFDAAVAAQPDQFACRAGCHRCCHVDLTVFSIEAERARAAFAALPATTRRAAAARAERGQHCALLHPRTGRCLIYEARPLICRSFGLATLFEGKVTWCPLNYPVAAPRRECVLDLEAINQPLALMEQLAAQERTGRPQAGRKLARVRLADLAREAGPLRRRK